MMNISTAEEDQTYELKDKVAEICRQIFNTCRSKGLKEPNISHVKDDNEISADILFMVVQKIYLAMDRLREIIIFLNNDDILSKTIKDRIRSELKTACSYIIEDL